MPYNTGLALEDLTLKIIFLSFPFPMRRIAFLLLLVFFFFFFFFSIADLHFMLIINVM